MQGELGNGVGWRRMEALLGRLLHDLLVRLQTLHHHCVLRWHMT
jgi:hypothetical protein